jgi:hypothetical protein
MLHDRKKYNYLIYNSTLVPSSKQLSRNNSNNENIEINNYMGYQSKKMYILF